MPGNALFEVIGNTGIVSAVGAFQNVDEVGHLIILLEQPNLYRIKKPLLRMQVGAVLTLQI